MTPSADSNEKNEGNGEGNRDRDGAGSDDDLELVVIAAVAANGVIGADGGIPWYLPADLRHFKRLTTGHPVVMGRATYESIADRLGGPLPGRTNVVLTREDRGHLGSENDAGNGDRGDNDRKRDAGTDGDAGTVVVAGGCDAAIEAAGARDDVAFVIGGATVYKQLLPAADRLVLTEIGEAYEGNVTFPDRDREEWTELARDDREGFSFVEYARTGTAASARYIRS